MSDPFRNRQLTIQAVFIIAAGVLIFKAMQLQLLDNKYRSETSVSAVDKFTVYPPRGVIYDRNGELLVYNNPMYDLMLTYNQMDQDMDVEKFCELVEMTPEEFDEAKNKDWRSPRFNKSIPYVFKDKISAKDFARFQENLYEFPGFFVQLRNVRGYPHNTSPHLLGFIREVNRKELEAQEPDESGNKNMYQ